MRREILYKGILFKIADYRPRKNEFEKKLKYMLLIQVFDGSRTIIDGKVIKDYCYHDTGYRFSTINECKKFITKNYFIWL